MRGRLDICGSVVVDVTVCAELSRTGTGPEDLVTLAMLSAQGGMETHRQLHKVVTLVIMSHFARFQVLK